MTDRVKISVMGITHSQIQKGAYAVLLTEDGTASPWWWASPKHSR